MHTPLYHHSHSIQDHMRKVMNWQNSKHYHPARSYRQRLQFQLAAPQYLREPKYWT